MSEVKRLAQSFLGRVGSHDSFLDADGLADERRGILSLAKGVGQFVHLSHGIAVAADKNMFEHLRHAAEEVFFVERSKESAVEDDVLGLVEGSDFVLQSLEVDARLSASRCIHHR